MDDSQLNDLKKEAAVDNSRLEELMRSDITPQMQMEFFEELKKSQLFMPVDFGPNPFGNLEDLKPGDVVSGPEGFDILFLTDDKGNKAVPLFTSDEVMRQVGVNGSVIAIYMSDLADMLRQTDRYSVISINPFTEHDLNMPIGAFLSQFEEEPDISDIRNDRIREILSQKEFSDEEIKELADELLNAIMITGCVDTDRGTSFVIISNSERKPHLPLFTDIGEFEKMFNDYKGDVYPAAYRFADLVRTATEYIVINPASESFVFNPEMFRKE